MLRAKNFMDLLERNLCAENASNKSDIHVAAIGTQKDCGKEKSATFSEKIFELNRGN